MSHFKLANSSRQLISYHAYKETEHQTELYQQNLHQTLVVKTNNENLENTKKNGYQNWNVSL